MPLNLQYPLGSYSVSNKPSVETLKGDLANVQTTVNANETTLGEKLPSSYLDTDTTLAANSDVKIPSQKAIKTYSDSGTQTLTNKTFYSPTFNGNISGWTWADGTWTASDANTISINQDFTSILQKGDKIRVYNDSAWKTYYVSTTPVHSGATTFDVIGNVALVAGAITSPSYSHQDNPFGFPSTMTYTPTVTAGTGSITSYTVNKAKFRIAGGVLTTFIDVLITNAGTGAGALNITLPVTAVYGSGCGRENAVSGKALQVQIGTTNFNIFTYDNLTPIATNALVQVVCTHYI